MRIYVDTADLAEIEEWDRHPWVSGFTTNPTLMRDAQDDAFSDPWKWAKELVSLTDKPVSIDGPTGIVQLGENVWRKQSVHARWQQCGRTNWTAVCHPAQLDHLRRRDEDDSEPYWAPFSADIISVFAGRIMDTGRDPQPTIDAAKATGAEVLWASVREPYNIVQAEQAGCDICTVPPHILRKYLEWHGKPLETVAAETIAQFERDAEGLW